MPEQKRTEAAIADPSSQFKSPMDVLSDATLDYDAKHAILESWKKDAELLSTATNENMAGGENPLPSLQDVAIALERLEKSAGRIN
jgi:hypothetical protein